MSFKLFITEDGQTYKGKVGPDFKEFFANEPYIDDPLFLNFENEELEPWQEIEVTRIGSEFKITNYRPDWAETINNEATMDNKITAVKITRPDCGGWMFAGTTPEEVIGVVKSEIEANLSEEGNLGDIHIEEFQITQKEIDEMGDFEGW